MAEIACPPPATLVWLQALRHPELALDWTLPEWERVIRLARRLRLMARLAETMQAAGLMDRVPAQARRHLIAEQRLSLWRTNTMVWTIERVGSALQDAPYPKVLLKGAAYIGQGLAIAKGRLPSDLDILVPRLHLPDAQRRLALAGWEEQEMDAHDRVYYHEWSHEVPPMRHPTLSLELDLHHNILPPVARTRVDADLLLAHLAPSRWTTWQVFDPVDQVLHSAAHLFLDSEARDRIRDLADLDGLFRHFASLPDFWHRLPQRAVELGLAEPLSLASYFTVHWLSTPIPDHTLEAIVRQGPSRMRRAWLLPLLEKILMPTEPDARPSVAQSTAATIFLARYHRQRMPLRLLLPHLWHKLRAPDQTSADDDLQTADR